MHQLIQNAIDALSFGSLYALFALGIALIFGIMGLINFAHGELIMVGGYTIVLLAHPPWPVVILATIAVAVVFALAMERVAFRPLRGASPPTLLIACPWRHALNRTIAEPRAGAGVKADCLGIKQSS